MTPAALIAKWQFNAGTGRAVCQAHDIDLCRWLDGPDLSDDAILARLPALNHERAAAETITPAA